MIKLIACYDRILDALLCLDLDLCLNPYMASEKGNVFIKWGSWSISQSNEGGNVSGQVQLCRALYYDHSFDTDKRQKISTI